MIYIKKHAIPLVYINTFLVYTWGLSGLSMSGLSIQKFLVMEGFESEQKDFEINHV